MMYRNKWTIMLSKPYLWLYRLGTFPYEMKGNSKITGSDLLVVYGMNHLYL